MEAQDSMILRDMPVETRNYIIIDNITGKPIDQSNYTLSIDPEVIGKLNKLKKINEEKVKQAALRDKYGNTNIASTFTPKDNAVFTPVYNDEYIDFQDFNSKEEVQMIETPEKEEVIEEQVQDNQPHAEVITSDTLLDRVVARDPSVRLQEQEEAKIAEEPKEELDYISNYNPNAEQQAPVEETAPSAPVDNSVFTPEMANLQTASEQIIKIDPDKLGGDIKAHKEQKQGTERIKLDKMEVISGRKIAWTAYILFFIPLLFKKNNRFVRIHANEGLELNIVELLGGLLVAQYFLLPKIMENISANLSMVSLIACWIGAALVGVCALTCVIALIASLFGNQHQTPWLWKRRMIHVATERTSD